MTAVLYEGGNVRITISDKGVGIPDVAKAMEPMYTTATRTSARAWVLR